MYFIVHFFIPFNHCSVTMSNNLKSQMEKHVDWQHRSLSKKYIRDRCGIVRDYDYMHIYCFAYCTQQTCYSWKLSLQALLKQHIQTHPTKLSEQGVTELSSMISLKVQGQEKKTDKERKRKEERKGVHAGEGNYTSALELKGFKLPLNQKSLPFLSFCLLSFCLFFWLTTQ